MTGDWTLSYVGTELVFGSHESVMGFASAPAVGLPDEFIDDFGVPSGDGRLFGVDYLGGQTVTFEVDIFTPGDREAAEAVLAEMRRAWRGDAIRTEPGAVATLTADSGRVTFGRPRRFVADQDGDRDGVVRVTADFATSTDLWFGAEDSVEIGLIPPAGGGLVAPLSAPLSTTASSDRSRVFVVGGRTATPPVIEVTGPITNPVVEVLGVFRMEFRLTLAYDETLVVDTRTHARTVTRNGASVAGVLTAASTRLSDASVPPGPHELVLRGTSSTGTPTARLSWRDAFFTH